MFRARANAVLIEVQNGERFNPPRLTHAEWLAVSRATDGGIERYILYFLSRSGEILTFAQRNTLREALAEAAASIGFASNEWKSADIEVPAEPRIPRGLLP